MQSLAVPAVLLASILPIISCNLLSEEPEKIINDVLSGPLAGQNNSVEVRTWINSFLDVVRAENEPENRDDWVDGENPCGAPILQTRVVGGTEAYHLEFPWMVQINAGGNPYCGATLITAHHIISAAHCFHNINTDRFSVILFHDDHNEIDSRRIVRTIDEVYIHPNYSPRRNDADIAILTMNQPVELKGFVRTLCLPDVETSFERKSAVVTGWGFLAENGVPSTTLQKLWLNIISNDDCSKHFTTNRITSNMICAIGNPGQDACQGDSGGPLHILGPQHEYVLAGIVSWGKGCARPDMPGVYTNVTSFLGWIHEVVDKTTY